MDPLDVLTSPKLNKLMDSVIRDEHVSDGDESPGILVGSGKRLFFALRTNWRVFPPFCFLVRAQVGVAPFFVLSPSKRAVHGWTHPRKKQESSVLAFVFSST